MQQRSFPLFFIDLLIAALICAPAILSPSGVLLGSGDVDVWNHAWGAWFWSTALSAGELPWQTMLLTYPDGGTLWFIDPILGLLGAPLALLSPGFAYNAIIFFYIAFASYGARRFAQALGVKGNSQWIAAIGVAGSSWIIAETHNGISEAINIGPAALAMAWVEEACRATHEHIRKWVKAGLGVGISFVASPYLGLGVGLVVAIRSLPKIKQAWVGGLTALGVAAIPVLTLQAQLHSVDAIIKRPEGMNESLALHNAVDPRIFFTPFGFQSRDLSDEGFYHTMYLSIAALVLAVPILKKRLWWLAGLLICMVCSWGPYLYWGDGWVLAGESKLRLPWWYLQSLFPGLAITHPLRMAVPCLIIVMGMASLRHHDTKWKAYFPWKWYALIPLDMLVFSGAPWPLETANATIPPIYAEIKADERDVGVLDLPTDAQATMRTSRYLFYQTAHGKGIPYAPDARASTSPLLRYSSFRSLASLCRRRPEENKMLGLHRGVADKNSLSSLKTAKIGWIVLHKQIDPEVTETLKIKIEQDLGPGMENESTIAWKLE